MKRKGGIPRTIGFNTLFLYKGERNKREKEGERGKNIFQQERAREKRRRVLEKRQCVAKSKGPRDRQCFTFIYILRVVVEGGVRWSGTTINCRLRGGRKVVGSSSGGVVGRKQGSGTCVGHQDNEIRYCHCYYVSDYYPCTKDAATRISPGRQCV